MRLLSQCNSLEFGGCNPGDVIDLPDEIAQEWIAKSLALPLPALPEAKKAPAVETAALEGAPETAVGRRSRK